MSFASLNLQPYEQDPEPKKSKAAVVLFIGLAVLLIGIAFYFFS